MKTIKIDFRRAAVIICTLFSAVAVNAQQKTTVFDNADFVVEPIKNINTIGSDISPFYVNDSLYFSGVREKYLDNTSREKKNKAFYSIYSASLDSEGKLTSNKVLVPGFGEDFHEGPADYCEATGELFVTVSSTENSDTIRKMISVEKIRLMLVVKKKIDGKWQTVEEFPYNNDKYHVAHPAISVTGDSLVFSADFDSLSYGNNDLYLSVRKNGKWSNPVNLGERINTPGNEMFPTFIGDNILSFASDGRKGGFGALDIWYVRFPVTDSPVNVGNKINTHLDDFGLVIHPTNKTGYFASNRGNVGSDDIFRLDIKAKMYVFNGKVVHKISGLPVANASVVLTNCSEETVNTVFTDGGGMFTVQVLAGSCPNVVAAKEGFMPDKKDVSGLDYIELRLTPERKYEITVLDVDTKKPVNGALISANGQRRTTASAFGLALLTPPFKQDEKMMITADGYLDQSLVVDTTRFSGAMLKDTVWLFKKELNKTFVLDNIYYNYDRWDILPASKLELNRLVKIMNDNPEIKVELGSHTDARGSDSYNEQLSQKRSDSAVAYIISSGIPKSRIVARGYGETQLVNHCKNGVQCSDDVHRQNRRTEFKIIGL